MKLSLTRAEKKTKTAEEVENAFGRIVLVLGMDKFDESLLFIDWGIKNQSKFISGWEEKIDKNKPHIGRRAAIKFIELCEEYDNNPVKVYLFCKEINDVCFRQKENEKEGKLCPPS